MRTKAYLDVENLIRTPEPTGEDLRWLQAVIRPLFRDDTQVVWATTQWAIANDPELAWGWPGAQLKVTYGGPDASDRALSETMAGDPLALFDQVVIGSGDGHFIPQAAELAASGLHVVVLSHLECLHPVLRLAAHDVYLMPPVPGSTGQALVA